MIVVNALSDPLVLARNICSYPHKGAFQNHGDVCIPFFHFHKSAVALHLTVSRSHTWEFNCVTIAHSYFTSIRSRNLTISDPENEHHAFLD